MYRTDKKRPSSEGFLFGTNFSLVLKTVMKTARVKNFSEFLGGAEVTAVVQLKGQEMIEQGEQVLAIKESVASHTGVPVPQGKLHEAMGVEAMVTSTGNTEDGNQLITIRKA
jgi:hypothetical protein